jgi:outer membrane protein
MKVARHAVTLAAGVAVCAFAPRLHAQVRIAVVDLQRVLDESEDGRRAKTQLERFGRELQRSIDSDAEKVKALNAEHEKQTDWDEATRRAKQAELEAAVIAVQKRYVEAQQKISKREAELTRPILERARSIVAHLAQVEGYTVVLERSHGGVVWAPSTLDITDVVIQHHNSRDGREPAAAPPRTRQRESVTPRTRE